VRSRSLVFAAAVAFIASCTGSEDCTVSTSSCGSYALTFDVTPRTVTLAVGDTGSVAIAVQQSGRAARAEVRWTATPPAVVALDSSTVARSQVRVQAIAVGSSLLGFVVNVGGQTVQGTVPVTVTTP
jgi:uncharacterized protein YjdB